MDYSTILKLEKLNTKIENTKIQLTEDLNRESNIMLSAVTTIKADIHKTLNEHLQEVTATKELFEDKLNTFTLDIKNHQANKEKEIVDKHKQLVSKIDSLNAALQNIRFDIIDNHDNISITYINPDGKLEYGAIKKVLPDNDSIAMNEYNRLCLNYKFDPESIVIDQNKIIKATALYTGDKYLSASQIQSDLNTASYNISTLSYKLEKVLKQLNSVNGYIASNNFKKPAPTQDALTEFALSCLSENSASLTAQDIPAGTKIKNLFDNHIWVLNKVSSSDGLTQIKWEDFGSDNICIAGNNGIHGLISGSHDKLKGYIDVKGVLSINGLEEELTSIHEALLSLTDDFNHYKQAMDTHLIAIEQRLSDLEK